MGDGYSSQDSDCRPSTNRSIRYRGVHRTVTEEPTEYAGGEQVHRFGAEWNKAQENIRTRLRGREKPGELESQEDSRYVLLTLIGTSVGQRHQRRPI